MRLSSKVIWTFFISTIFCVSASTEKFELAEITKRADDELVKNNQQNHYVVDLGSASDDQPVKRQQQQADHKAGHQRNANEERFRRSKRGLNDIQLTKFNLSDSHGLIVVHWAGEDSDVIIALARDAIMLSFIFSSNLYISRDYGKTFVKQNLTLGPSWPNVPAAVHWYYISPVYTTHFVFADVIHKTIWTTSDRGLTYSRYSLTFYPHLITFHPTNWNTFVAYQYSETGFAVSLSTVVTSFMFIHL
ncbi:hypothetical protein HELRODRAFT_182808 [Helobdella robusta]|uniref:Sortilin N-terminal domain-containing protein n=1 Tax=Helobdella robusta TaxID=6412 RepID=T1FIS4_HELRO|nr:hypothetical protein HELRODRAFT_182808 [Helobdella robusta]ESN90114.1 hypothetical protein HELRODRAFT_182808 [Helobdella robusta]